jgi:transposase InsO family protein
MRALDGARATFEHAAVIGAPAVQAITYTAGRNNRRGSKPDSVQDMAEGDTRSWLTRESVELATLEWVSWFNHHRLLGPIGYVPPAEAEANYYRQLASQTATVAA